MSSYLKKFARDIHRKNAILRQNAHIVWAYMKYTCTDCGYSVYMYLEKGLEHGGKQHKPVPFAITCPKCGGFHCYDSSGLIKLLSGPRPLKANEHYFKNTLKADCGVPVHPTITERRTDDQN